MLPLSLTRGISGVRLRLTMECSAEVGTMEDESEGCDVKCIEEVFVTMKQEVQDPLLTVECSADVGTMEDKSEGDVKPLEEVLVTVNQDVQYQLLPMEWGAHGGDVEPLEEVLIAVKLAVQEMQDPLLECSTLAGGNGFWTDPQEQCTVGCNSATNDVRFECVLEENVPADAAVLPSNNSCKVCSLDPTDCQCLQHHEAQCVPRKFDDNKKVQDVPISSLQLGNASLDSNKTIFQESELVKTIRVRTGEGRFKCGKCSKSLFRKSRPSRHLEIHTRPFSCQWCGRTYSQENFLTVHKMMHTGERPFTCKICYKSFVWKNHLDKHKTIHTRGGSENKEKERIFKSQRKAVLRCHLCSKLFTKKQSLIYHKLINAGERPFPCDLCGRSFIRNGDLILHVKTHVCMQPFKCEICMTSFSEKRELVIHMRSHTPKLPYPCYRCGKSFVGRVDYTLHSRGHRGKYRYMCPTCGRMFLHNQSLILHITTHNGDFSCKVCCKSFLRNCDLARHTLFVHKTR